eukprot:3703402-Rhodomonas_salina.1
MPSSRKGPCLAPPSLRAVPDSRVEGEGTGSADFPGARIVLESVASEFTCPPSTRSRQRAPAR